MQSKSLLKATQSCIKQNLPVARECCLVHFLLSSLSYHGKYEEWVEEWDLFCSIERKNICGDYKIKDGRSVIVSCHWENTQLLWLYNHLAMSSTMQSRQVVGWIESKTRIVCFEPLPNNLSFLSNIDPLQPLNLSLYCPEHIWITASQCVHKLPIAWLYHNTHCSKWINLVLSHRLNHSYDMPKMAENIFAIFPLSR